MQTPDPFTVPPLPDFAALAHVILTAGFGIVAVLFLLGTVWEMLRKR